ncbi:MAG: PEP/pyruvate-binding domain-containing protein, partial [Steroidobacteraceae bacterium]
DSAKTSFAGIFRSCLNVRGLPAVLEAVRKVWDSVESPSAQAYRQRLAIGEEQIGMAVVVMPLLPAVAAGIAFTCDPVSGRRDQLLIHAHWGLGEALVSGQADGDEYRLQLTDWDDTQPLVPVGQRRGSKSRMTVLAEQGGTRLRDTPVDLAASAVLDAQQIMALGRLVLETASALDYSASGYDVEWVWDGERFWIVQARPVTRSARRTYPALSAQPTYWSRMNSREVAPEPLSAFEWSTMRSVLHRMMVCTLQLAGYRVLEGVERVALRHGRFYIDTTVWQWEAFDAFDLLPAAATDMFGGQQPPIAVPRPTLSQRVARKWRNLRYLIRCVRPRRRGRTMLRRAREQAARWRAAGQPAASADLLQQLRVHCEVLRDADDLFFLQVSSGSAHFILFDLARKHCHDEGYGIAAALLAGGEPSATAAQSYELMELAQIAAGDAPALAWLRSPDRIGSDWPAQLPQDSGFRRAFA